MPDIQAELQRFMNAKFGADVRDAFVSCILKIHNENLSYDQIKAEIVELANAFNLQADALMAAVEEAERIGAQAGVDASNAMEMVSGMENDIKELQEDTDLIATTLADKIDDARVSPDGYLYLMSNGEDVVGPLGPFSGGGGGGGGTGGNNAELTVTNTSGWLSKTIAHGSPCEIKFLWYSVEEEIPTGNGVLKITVNGAVKATLDIAQGNVTVDVSPYLSVGSNSVRINIADVYGNNRTINFSISSVALSLNSTFDASKAYSGPISFTYVPTGNVSKTVHFILDGRELGTNETSISGRQLSYVIPAQKHGAHTLTVYFEANIDNQTVRSNTLYYEIICIERLNNTPIIVSSFNTTTVAQYTSITIPYAVYDPANLTAEVTLSANGSIVSRQTVDRTQQLWSYRADEVGELTLEIASGSVKKEITLTVTESEIDIEAETEGLSLYLSSYGRSNNEENPGKWEYNDISAVFENFNFTSDGWRLDDDGITVLRVAGDARLTIPAQIFAEDFRSSGKTIELEFATRNVMDYDAAIMSCLSGNRGFELTAQRATLRSEQSTISTQFKEDEHVRIAFVVEKRVENRLLYIYINGIMSGVVQYPQDDDFSQTSPVGISVGSNDCTIDLYCIRVYDNDLTRHQILNNWIADTQNVTDMLIRYQHNSVYDEYGEVVISSLPNDLPYLVLQGDELPQYKGDKKTMSGYYTNPANPAKSFTFEGASVDVQGTSSQYYARKNYKIKFAGGFVGQSGSNTPTYSMRNDSIPTDTFTFKADVASSEGANNVELARLYNDACPYKTPPQVISGDIRQGIDGFPIVVFWNDGQETTFLGKYNFNNDKATEEVFGFQEGDESWEILNNTSNRVLWKSSDFSGEDWKNDFEARYPEDSVDTARLAELAAWLESTDQSVVESDDEKATRLQKFKEEIGQHIEKDSMIFYYLFTELFLMVDSRAKNAFPSIFQDGKWCFLPYDFDTAIGINNEGTLAFSYNLEDIDKTDTGADVYNGQQSVLWINTRQAFYDDIMSMYQTLRSTGALSYPDTEQRFEDHQAVWPEAIFNEDAYFKYLAPLINEGSSAYLAMLQGSKAEQRKWWLYNRFRYLDSKYNAGDALSDVITVRGYAKANVKVTPYADVYASVKYGSYLVQKRAARGQEYELVCPLDNVNDTEIYIYSASQLASVGDLSGLKVGYAEFSLATKLQNLKLGDSSAQYSNTNLTELHLGNNVLLKTLDVRNCPNLTQAIDVSGCANIEEIYFEGTAITGIQLPNGGILKVLHLPASLTNLTILNQKAITDLTIPSYNNISTLRLENVSAAVDSKAMLSEIPAACRVRIIGFAWEAESADAIFELYNLLDTMRGLDEQGNNTEKAQLGGTIHLEALTGAELAQMKERYPNIDVTFDHITSYLYFYNYDGSQLLYKDPVYDGGDGEYSGTPPTRSSTAQYTYSFVGWSKQPNSTSADPDALTGVTADRNVYAAFSATVRKYRVRFYNGSTLLQTVNDVQYGGSASYTGEDPVKTDVNDPENYKFNGWNPSPSNIQGDTDCYAVYTYIGLEETITDTWEQIFAAIDNGTYKDKYKINDTKILDVGPEGSVCMQIKGFDKDDLADGSGKAPITWISEQLLATSHRMNPALVTLYDYPQSESWAAGSGSSANTWSTQIAYCADEKAKATWTVTADEDGTVTIGYRTSNTSTSYNKLTLDVNQQNIVTDWAGNGGSSSTYQTTTVECHAGDTVTVTAEYTQTSSSSSYTGYVQFSSTGKFHVDAVVENAKKRVQTGYQEGTGSIGGWEETEMRTYVKSLKQYIPEPVRSRIKEVKKTQTAYNTSGSSFTQTTTDDLWIPDYNEIFSSSGLYYEAFPDSASRIKKKAGASSASIWWLRYANSTAHFRYVNTSGSYNIHYANSAYGVCLGFST